MADHSRLDDLRRRVEKDPASIAFAQLAEEYRRAGQLEQAVEVCRAGLHIHQGYLSARVTLGRALLELNQLVDAQHELEEVLHSAPENLAAIRGLAEIHHRLGHLPEALTQYRAALSIARNDPDLERTVEELSQQVSPQPRAEPADAMSFDQMHTELLASAAAASPRAAELRPQPDATAGGWLDPPPIEAPGGEQAAAASAPILTPVGAISAVAESDTLSEASGITADVRLTPDAAGQDSTPVEPDFTRSICLEADVATLRVEDAVQPPAPEPAPQYNVAPTVADDRALRTIAALTRWLDALNVARTVSRA